MSPVVSTVTRAAYEFDLWRMGKAVRYYALPAGAQLELAHLCKLQGWKKHLLRVSVGSQWVLSAFSPYVATYFSDVKAHHSWPTIPGSIMAGLFCVNGLWLWYEVKRKDSKCPPLRIAWVPWLQQRQAPALLAIPLHYLPQFAADNSSTTGNAHQALAGTAPHSQSPPLADPEVEDSGAEGDTKGIDSRPAQH